jgi:hypothetical protein
MPDLAAEFRQRAEMCRRNAEAATYRRDRADWLDLAEVWFRLAEEADPSASAPGRRYVQQEPT